MRLFSQRSPRPIYLVPIFLSGIIASNKGRNVVLWVSLGLIFGVFAVVVLAFLSNLNGSSTASQAGMRVCPHCISQVPYEATVCRFCQREMPLLSLASQSGGH